MALLTINGTAIQTPSSYKVTVSDIDSESTTRDLSGTMHRDKIATKRKIEISYKVVDDSKIKALLDAISAVSFTLRYKDLDELIKLCKLMSEIVAVIFILMQKI